MQGRPIGAARTDEIRLITDQLEWLVRAPAGELPGPAEADVMLAVLELWNAAGKAGRAQGDWSVTLSARRLAQLVGRSYSGAGLRAIDRSMQRLSATVIRVREQNGAWRQYGLLAVRATPTARGGNAYTIAFPPTSIVGGARMLVDVGPVFALRSPLARRLALLLATARYQGRGARLRTSVVLSTSWLAARLPLSSRFPSVVLRVLAHAHDELRAAGLLLAAEPIGGGEIAYQFPEATPAAAAESRRHAEDEGTAVVRRIAEGLHMERSTRFLVQAVNRLGPARLWAHFADVRAQMREDGLTEDRARQRLGARLRDEMARVKGAGAGEGATASEST